MLRFTYGTFGSTIAKTLERKVEEMEMPWSKR
jgi:hypothetical protein